jgi:predicted DNA-binding mobile mystery protein A
MDYFTSDKLFSEEVMLQAAKKMKMAMKGRLSIGAWIRTTRKYLGMSQSILAKRARVPQSTISRVENGEIHVNISTLQKILQALSCDLLIVPQLHEPIDVIRRKQARKIAEKHMRYLKGTMSLEQQQLGARFIEELMKQEEERLLQEKNSKLWEE